MMTAKNHSYQMARERNLILASLLLIAATSWGWLVWQARLMDAQMMSGQMIGGLTMGMGVMLFLVMWVVMMVAMMFPTAAPMILMFARVAATRQQRGQVFVPTWVFVAAYLLLWTLAGVVAYGLALGATALAMQVPWLMEQAGRVGGLTLVTAGLYQLTPLKHACLSHCRSPLHFVMQGWREGYGGTVWMGLEHGLYCLGCCWLLFVILFPLGIMNVGAMALITLLIFAEKTLPHDQAIVRAGAASLIAYGLLVLAMPHLLPTMTMPMMN